MPSLTGDGAKLSCLLSVTIRLITYIVERQWSHCQSCRWRAGIVAALRGRGCVPLIVADSLARDSLLRLPVARAMCDRLAALDGLVPPAAVACRSTPSSPNAYRAVVQLQQLEKTASVPDLQQKRHHHGDGPAADYQAAPASACPDSKSDGCLTDTGRRAPVTSLSGTFLTPPCKVSRAFIT